MSKHRFVISIGYTNQLVSEIPTPHFHFANLQNPEIALLTINKKSEILVLLFLNFFDF